MREFKLRERCAAFGETGCFPGEKRAFAIDAPRVRPVNFSPLPRQPLHISHTLVRIGGRTVNKNDLVGLVSTQTGMSRNDATRAVDGVFDAITAALKNGDEVRLVGFGTFTVASRAASEGRNPRTGEKIQIPASKQPKFKAGNGLKDAIN
jgi:DNA-binding protein HU-beta